MTDLKTTESERKGGSLLLEEQLGVFPCVHPTQMLLEVIQARPPLARTRAVLSEAKVHHLGPPLRFLIVNTLLVAGQVIDGTEALFPRTVRLVTFEELSMTGFVLPIWIEQAIYQYTVIIFRKTRELEVDAYLLSDGHLPTHEQAGWSHFTEASKGPSPKSWVKIEPVPIRDWSNSDMESTKACSLGPNCGLDESTAKEEGTTE